MKLYITPPSILTLVTWVLQGRLMKLYVTPPSILTLVTWVPQSRLAFDHSAYRLVIGPPALAKSNPTMCSLACRWWLQLALRFNREFFL